MPHDFPLPHLPSRLFRFPIEVSAGHGETPRRIGLMHPLLADYPFVRPVEEVLGIVLDPDGAPNAYGVSNARTGLWWHAVDLVSAGHWRALLETRHFTTDEDIARAVAYGLSNSHYVGKPQGYLSVTKAHAIMAGIDAPEPAERCGLLAFSRPPAGGERKRMARPVGKRLVSDDLSSLRNRIRPFDTKSLAKIEFRAPWSS